MYKFYSLIILFLLLVLFSKPIIADNSSVKTFSLEDSTAVGFEFRVDAENSFEIIVATPASEEAVLRYIKDLSGKHSETLVVSSEFGNDDKYTFRPLNSRTANKIRSLDLDIEGVSLEFKNDISVDENTMLNRLANYSDTIYSIVATLPKSLKESIAQRSTEEKVFILSRSSAQSALTVFIALDSGISAVTGIFGTSVFAWLYQAGVQHQIARINEFIAKDGAIRILNQINQSKFVNNAGVFINRWAYAFAWPIALTLGMNYFSGIGPTIAPEEWGVIASAATKSVLAGTFWDQFIIDVAKKPNLTAEDQKKIARTAFTLELIDVLLVSTSLMGLKITDVAFTVYGIAGAGVYFYKEKILTLTQKALEKYNEFYKKSKAYAASFCRIIRIRP